MNDEEWSRSEDPQQMLDLLRGNASDRKLRLFACACCRQIWDAFPDECSRRAVEVSEAFADGLESQETLVAASEAVRELWHALSCDLEEADCSGHRRDLSHPVRAVEAALFASQTAWRGGYNFAGYHENQAEAVVLCSCAATEEYGWERALTLRANLLRCIFDHPLRPLSVDPAILTDTVVSLARAAYETRLLPTGILDPQRLAILADALEEEGAIELAIPLRMSGLHVRGCAVLDLLLQKA